MRTVRYNTRSESVSWPDRGRNIELSNEHMYYTEHHDRTYHEHTECLQRGPMSTVCLSK